MPGFFQCPDQFPRGAGRRERGHSQAGSSVTNGEIVPLRRGATDREANQLLIVTR
jgi:hypothetical protein